MSAPASATASASAFSLEHLLHPDRIASIVGGLLLFAIGWLIARSLTRLFESAMQHHLSRHQLQIRSRLIYHGILVLFALTGLSTMGVNLTVLLGAAGVLSVAIGFASQTSASNLISGIFLIGEGSFTVGDFIRVGNTEGEVLSIDLLSVKLRTADNLYVRLPNEQLIKTEVINLTRFAIRRINLPVGIAYKEDIGRVRRLLLQVAAADPCCLDEPAPMVIMQNFGDSAINLMFYVWVRRENHLQMRDRLQEDIKEAFDANGIEIPFPQLAINASSDHTPLPLQIMVPPEAGSSGTAPATPEK
ncbi:MAG: mechanosensitive ion channel family protein [Moraxellaceae bacterium]